MIFMTLSASSRMLETQQALVIVEAMTLGQYVSLVIIFHLHLYFSEILRAKKTLTLTKEVTSVPSLRINQQLLKQLLSILLTVRPAQWRQIDLSATSVSTLQQPDPEPLRFRMSPAPDGSRNGKDSSHQIISPVPRATGWSGCPCFVQDRALKTR